MEQTRMMFSKPLPGELFKPGSQDYRLYELLLAGVVTNADIIDKLRIFSYTRRVSDLREKLRPYCMDVKATRIKDGLFEYKLI